jgi:hypothetical protein
MKITKSKIEILKLKYFVKRKVAAAAEKLDVLTTELTTKIIVFFCPTVDIVLFENLEENLNVFTQKIPKLHGSSTLLWELGENIHHRFWN